MTRTLIARYLRQRPAVMVMLTGWFFLGELGGDSAAALGALVLGMALFSWPVVPSGVTAFTCALPIRGRDLVMSRVLAMVAVTAIPVGVWLALELVSGQVPPTILLPSVQLAALALALGAAGVVAWVHYTVPDALPIPFNSTAARKDQPERTIAVGRDAAWWSVVRTALPPGYPFYCVLLFGAGAVGVATPIYCVVLLFLPVMIRQRTAWLTALPVSYRQRLRVIVLPTVVAFVACIGLGRVLQLSVLGRPEPLSGDYRLWLIEAVVLMTLGVVVMLLSEMDGAVSRRRRGTVALFLRELATLPVAAVLAADIVLRLRGTDGLAALTARTLHDSDGSSALHAWSVLVLAAMVLVTACALLEHQFRRSGTLSRADAPTA